MYGSTPTVVLGTVPTLGIRLLVLCMLVGMGGTAVPAVGTSGTMWLVAVACTHYRGYTYYSSSIHTV